MTNTPRNIQWSAWGNETTLLGAYILFLGGIISIIGGIVEQYLYWLPIGIYGIVLGLFVSAVEYPRGKKMKGKSVTRDHQESLTRFVAALRFPKSYYARSLFYLVIALPAGLVVPTVLGAVCILAGAGIYFGAATHGEKWEPIGSPSSGSAPSKSTSPPTLAPPSQPPPRLPEKSF